MTIAFTGHRPQHLGERAPLVEQALHKCVPELVRMGFVSFYSGMALGVDSWAAEAVLAAKADHPEIQLIAAVPMLTQAMLWHGTPGAVEKWYDILRQADRIELIEFGEDDVPYDVFCQWVKEREAKAKADYHYAVQMLKLRNQQMVDRSDALCACWNGKKDGGTYNCLKYALRRHKPVHWLNVATLTLEPLSEA